MQAGGISIHGVDVARGVAADGLMVELHALAPLPRLLAKGRLGSNGLLDHPTARGEGIESGPYEVRLHVGEWLKSAGYPDDQTHFLDIVPFRFVVSKPAEHYHLPFKFTPWGLTLFRGF